MAVQFKRSTALGSLSITPLIDVVFLLLIFFLVATRFAEQDRSLEVELPSADSSQPLTQPPDAIFVNINQQGRFYVNGKFMGAAEMESVVTKRKRDNPLTQTVIINADRRVNIQPVVRVMSLCNKLKLKYTLTTEGKNG